MDASAILEVTPTNLLVVVSSTRAASMTIQIATGGDVARSVVLELDLESGIGMIDIDELAPDTGYTVVIDGSRTHSVRTAPADDARRPVRLAVSADYDPSPAFTNDVIDAIIANEPELYVSIGDFPYTDNGPVARSIEDYRRRHLETRTAAPIRALHEAMGVYAIYDDHEFRNNWDAMFVAAEPDRYAAAVRVWDEFFPTRAVVSQVRYRRWRWGANVECFLLDCRRFRSANAARDDATKTMLGADQLAWFLSAIASSTATFKLVFSSVPLDYGTGNDSWPSFGVERQAIFDHLTDAGITGVLVISGDQHWFAAQRHAYGIREFQIGPLARGFGTPPAAVPNVLFRNVDYNAGLIDVALDRLTFSGVGPDGQIFYRETFTIADLTPRRDS